MKSLFPLYLGNKCLEPVKNISLNEVVEIISTGKIELDRNNKLCSDWILSLSDNKDYIIEATGDIFRVTLPVKCANPESKSLLPAVIFNANSPNNSRLRPFEKLSGFFIQDIDLKNVDLNLIEDEYSNHEAFTKDIFDDIKRNADGASGIVFAWVSPSNKGIKVLYNYSIKKGKETDLNSLQKISNLVNINLEHYLGLNLQDYATVINGTDGKCRTLDVLDFTSDRAKQLCYISKSNTFFENKKYNFLDKNVKTWKNISDVDKYIEKKEKEFLSGFNPNSNYESGFDTAITSFLGSMNQQIVPSERSYEYITKWFDYTSRTGVAYKNNLIKKWERLTTGKSFKGRKTIIKIDEHGEETYLIQGSWFIWDEKKQDVTINRTQLEGCFADFGLSYLDDEPDLFWIDAGIIKKIGNCKIEFRLFTSWYNKVFIKYYKNSTNIFEGYKDSVAEVIKDKTLDYIKLNIEKMDFDTIDSSSLIEDTRKECLLNLSNGKLKITKDKVELISYSKSNPVFEGQIRDISYQHFLLNNDYEPRPYTWKDYRSLPFYYKITEGNQQKLKSLMTLLGMSIHKFKKGSPNIINILMDGFNEDTKKAGGTGKSLIVKNLEFIRNIAILHSPKSGNFDWQTVDKGTEIVYMEDVKFKHFSISDLRFFMDKIFTVEKKYKQPFLMKDDKCPRCVITTNYVPDSEEDADTRRVNIFCVPAYFGKNNPVSYLLGYRMFEDYNSDDWHCWLLFIIECIQTYLKEGLIKHEEAELLNRKKLAKFTNNVEFEDLILCIEDEIENIKSGLKDKWEFKKIDLLNTYKSKVGSDKLDELIQTVCNVKSMIYESNKAVRIGNKVTKMCRISQRQNGGLPI